MDKLRFGNKEESEMINELGLVPTRSDADRKGRQFRTAIPASPRHCCMILTFILGKESFFILILTLHPRPSRRQEHRNLIGRRNRLYKFHVLEFFIQHPVNLL
jgi:hypothetical protein